MKSQDLIPVTKNGKFFGYATAEQIADNDCLAVFDENSAKKEVAKVKVEKAAAEKTEKDAAAASAEKAGADPSAVKKGPASK